MNRFRLSSSDGISGNTNENTVYFLSGSGAENKRPNIISRPKTKPPTPTSTTMQNSQQPQPQHQQHQQQQHQLQQQQHQQQHQQQQHQQHQQQQHQQHQQQQHQQQQHQHQHQHQQQQIVLSSGAGQTIQIPASMTVAGSSGTAVVTSESVAGSEGVNPVSFPIQILDEAASAEFLRANNAGNHQIITDASGAMTIETDDGNVMVILQNDDDDDSTTTGTIAFGHDMGTHDANTQIIQNVQFPTGDATVEVPTMEFGENDLPETTSYILVQMDDQGNNILVPASAFSSQVNGIPTLTQMPIRTTQQHQTYTTQSIRTTQHQQQQFNMQPVPVVQERGKPFRYVLPESEDGTLKMDDGSQYILNVLPGPSQPHTPYVPKPKKETTPKPKAPPKPKKPRVKKVVVQAGPVPIAASTPLPVKYGGITPKVTVAVVSQLPTTATVTAAPVVQVAAPTALTTTEEKSLVSTSTTVTAQPEPVVSAPVTNERNLIVVKLDPESGLTETIDPDDEEPEQSDEAVKSEGSQPGESGSTVAAALGKVVSTALGPAVPAAKDAVLPAVSGTGTTGPSKQIIVVGPKPSTSNSAVNGAQKKPAEEIVVTAFGTFKCTFCFKESTVRSHLVNHINRIHKGEKPFKCKVCNIGFQYSSSLKVHEKNHMVEKPFKCEYCECAFATDSNRNLHQKTVHLVPKDTMSLASSTPKLKFECATCKKAYCSKYNLLCHRLTHVDDFTKPILCDFCKKECKTKAILVNHVQTHKDAVGPFSCNVCDMSFTSESRLAAHKYMHKDKKKIYIKVEPVVENSKTIKVNVTQRKNMKISTPTPRRKKEKAGPVKEVFCSVCDDIFPTAEALEAHKEKKHGPGTAARTYSKRDSDQYESYLGKSFAKKLHQEKEKPGPSKGPKSKVVAKKLTPKVVPKADGKRRTPVKAAKIVVGRKTAAAKTSSTRPKRTETKPQPVKTVTTRGRPVRAAASKQVKKSPGGKKVVGKRGAQKGGRRGRKAKPKPRSESPSDESEEEPIPEKKPPVQLKEVSPKEKVAKPIKKRPIRTDPPEPVSEPNSSREPTPDTTNDPNVRKSSRKRGKNPYLEELKKSREKKIKARKQKEKQTLKRKSGDSEETIPGKRKRMIPPSPKKIETISPSPKKDDEDYKPLVGSSRGGRKRKLTETVIIAAAIPKKRPYPKEIQELIAGTSSTPVPVLQDAIPKSETGTDSIDANKPKGEGESSKAVDINFEKTISESTENLEGSYSEEKSETTTEEQPKLESEADPPEEMSEMITGDLDLDEPDAGEAGAGPSKSAEDSEPPTSTSSGEGQDDDKTEGERVDTSVPMKKRKVIKTERERDKEVNKDEVGKSFFQLFKQVKKDYVSSM